MITFSVVRDDEMKPRGIHAAFSCYIFYINTSYSTSYVYVFPDENLFFLFLRFFLSDLLLVIITCLDKVPQLPLSLFHVLRLHVCFTHTLQLIFRMMGELFAPI